MAAQRLVVPIVTVGLGIASIAGVAVATQNLNDDPEPAEVSQPATSDAEEQPVATEQPTLEQTDPPQTVETEQPEEDVATTPAEAPAERVSYTASLAGANEVPGDKPSGDGDATGTALVTIEGDEISFGLNWKGADTLAAAHIHRAPAGENGDIAVPLFESPLPAYTWSATGEVTAPELADRIRANPENYYVNLHTEEFPGGALRGQLAVSDEEVDPSSVIDKLELVANADGAQEVPGPGAENGQATVWIHPWGTCLDYAMTWDGIEPPTAAHVHKGVQGESGDVAGPLFETPLPETLTGIGGQAEEQDPAFVERLKANPENWYANIHTEDFPDGAVRGQLAFAGS